MTILKNRLPITTLALLTKLLAALILVFGGFNPAIAQDAKVKKATENDLPPPHQVIVNVTEALLSFVNENKEQLNTNPSNYYDGIQKILTPAVNFEYITKKVMGAYWSQASEAQRAKFQEVFARSMLVTYGKGMSNYANLTLNVLPPVKPVPEYGGTVVVQEIVTSKGTEKVVYFMGRAKGGTWQLINVVYEGVNLRDTSQGQFARLASENNNDIDATIAGWESAE